MNYSFQIQQVRKHGEVGYFTRHEAEQLVIAAAAKGYTFAFHITVAGYVVTDEDN